MGAGRRGGGWDVRLDTSPNQSVLEGRGLIPMFRYASSTGKGEKGIPPCPPPPCLFGQHIRVSSLVMASALIIRHL
jgi:hypothetical protein